MPRACVIVLDAVGAGELPDAGEYGDEGSNTLGNMASAVRGPDPPQLEGRGPPGAPPPPPPTPGALGPGTAMPPAGSPPQPGAPAVAGRLVERSKGKDT